MSACPAHYILRVSSFALCLLLISSTHCFATDTVPTAKTNSTPATDIFLKSQWFLTGWRKGDAEIIISTINNNSAIGADGSNSSILISGKSGKGQWSYAVSSHFFLVPERKYRMTGLMRVRFINNPAHPPHLRVALFQNSVWIGPNFTTKPYDLAKLNEWQQLSVEFLVPQGLTYTGNISVEKGTKKTVLDSIVELKNLRIEIFE